MSARKVRKPAAKKPPAKPQQASLESIAQAGGYVALPAAMLLKGIVGAGKVTGLPEGWTAVEWVNFWQQEVPGSCQMAQTKADEAPK